MGVATNTISTARLCKDCKWKRWHPLAWLCLTPKSAKIDPLTGKAKHDPMFCETQREHDLDDQCGPQGKYWEAKA